MMKKVLLFAAVLMLGLTACHKEPQDLKPGADALAGNWELVSVETKASVGDVNVSVYITFTAPDSFTLYQKIGEGRYTVFTGTYAVEDALLSGVYSNNKKWGPYTLNLADDMLKLTSANGGEVDSYRKIGEIPASVTSNLY